MSNDLSTCPTFHPELLVPRCSSIYNDLCAFNADPLCYSQKISLHEFQKKVYPLLVKTLTFGFTCTMHMEKVGPHHIVFLIVMIVSEG
jgi:hypothetical protein